MARDFDRQVAVLQVRAAVLNGYTALGIPVTELIRASQEAAMEAGEAISQRNEGEVVRTPDAP